jgi:hypothetical protein
LQRTRTPAPLRCSLPSTAPGPMLNLLVITAGLVLSGTVRWGRGDGRRRRSSGGGRGVGCRWRRKGRRAWRSRGGSGIIWPPGLRRVSVAVVRPLPGWWRQLLAGRQRLGCQSDPLAHEVAGGNGDRRRHGQPEQGEESPAQPAWHHRLALSRLSADPTRDHSITARAPRPSLFAMLTEPPHCSTSSRAIGRPSPVPVTPWRPARPR